MWFWLIKCLGLSNFALWYYTLRFSCTLHFQWPWLYFKVTAISNSFDWKFNVSIWLSWNFVVLLSASSRSYYVWLLHLFKGDNLYVFWFDKYFIISFFTNTVQARFFKLCIIITLLGGLPDYTRFDDLDPVWRWLVCQNYYCKLLFFRLLSTIVWNVALF